jgi:tetratricopeptide (TPR) repeat protein
MNPQLQSMLQQAIQAFQDGNFDGADLILKEVLQSDINTADAVFELGIAYAKANRFMEASAVFCCLQPYKNNDVRIPYNLGLIHSLQGSHQLALAAYDLALNIQPDDAEVLINKGSIYNDIQNYGLALKVLEKAIQIRPDIPEAWSNKGIALSGLNFYRESINDFNEAIRLAPNYHEAWSNKSVPLNKLKRFLEASQACDKALSMKPDYAEAYYNKGNALSGLKRLDESIVNFDKALSLKPSYAEAWMNKGNALSGLKRLDESIVNFDKALSLKPSYAEAWMNKGVTLHELKRFDEAIAHYDKALSLKPDYHEASWNKSLSLLLQGDFENGLPLYESRWDLENGSEIVGKRFFDKPTWLGIDSLKDKIILLYAEQGLGDSIQFCRYVKLVAGLGSKVILEVPQSLAGLMNGLEGVSQLVIKGEDLPFFDYQCPLLSLPLAFKTNLNTIPNPSRYINLDNHSNKIMEWKERLGLKTKPRVGLVWSGNSYHKNDHNRSLLLQEILPFLTNQYEYISLQKEVREIDKLTLGSNPHILSFNSYLNNFLDTAALIDNLDLVISVDTSMAHLSAALEKKTLVLLPSVPDWRWLLDREDSPWYPSIKLYRQTSVGDWNGVLDKVKFDLNSSCS